MDTFNKNHFNKKILTLSEQVERLKERGLIFDNEAEEIPYLFNISYYRLRAYTYPFQNNGPDEDHHFIRKDIHFKDIIDLYCFDRRLRSLIFNAIEKIEVALRTRIIQVYAEATGDSHWYTDSSLYRLGYEDVMEHIENDIDKSDEDFIKHYYENYDYPSLPPCWMAFEVTSLANLSRIYQALILDDKKKFIAKSFGLPTVEILENWLHAFTDLRNSCAHHNRIWNRRL